MKRSLLARQALRPNRKPPADHAYPAKSNCSSYFQCSAVHTLSQLERKCSYESEWLASIWLSTGRPGTISLLLYRGAMYVGSGVAKGASWIWNSSKQGVDNIKNRK